MALQLTLSCDLDKKDSGPTLIHSTGVQHYKIPPEVIRILQDNLTNDLLSDHQEGVLCQAGSQRVLDILRQNGFTLKDETTNDEKALWTVVQDGSGGGSGGGSEVPPPAPNPTPSDENDADAGEADAGEADQGEEDEGDKKEGEEEQPEEEE